MKISEILATAAVLQESVRANSYSCNTISTAARLTEESCAGAVTFYEELFKPPLSSPRDAWLADALAAIGESLSPDENDLRVLMLCLAAAVAAAERK